MTASGVDPMGSSARGLISPGLWPRAGLVLNLRLISRRFPAEGRRPRLGALPNEWPVAESPALGTGDHPVHALGVGELAGRVLEVELGQAAVQVLAGDVVVGAVPLRGNLRDAFRVQLGWAVERWASCLRERASMTDERCPVCGPGGREPTSSGSPTPVCTTGVSMPSRGQLAARSVCTTQRSMPVCVRSRSAES